MIAIQHAQGNINPERLTIGQMADLCSVSRKTLRFYHDKGLVSPSMLDKDTGYRYYSLDQMVIVDRIHRFQDMGFSLKQIKTLLDSRCFSERVTLYQQRLEEIRLEKAKLSMTTRAIEDFLSMQCSSSLADSQERVVLEWAPERKALFFELGDYSSQIGETVEDNQPMEIWYEALVQIKRELANLQVPVPSFDVVYSAISRKRLIARDYTTDLACVYIDDHTALRLRDYYVIPAGFTLSFYTSRFEDEQGRYLEIQALNAMLDYAAQHHYEIAGNYTASGNLDGSLSEGESIVLACHIPVTLNSSAQ